MSLATLKEEIKMSKKDYTKYSGQSENTVEENVNNVQLELPMETETDVNIETETDVSLRIDEVNKKQH